MAGFDHFKFIAPYYDKIISKGNFDRLIELSDLQIDEYVLDLGGGTGRVALALNKISKKIEVVDITLEMLRMARRKHLNAICANGKSLPFPGEFFSRVLVIDALHHLEAQKQVIREIWRVLRPGGFLIIVEPFYDQFSGKMIRIMENVLRMGSKFLSDCSIIALFDQLSSDIQVIHEKGNSFFKIIK
jgi:demethylmenaquinone methyltransferase/2-methoxy-6-polyprenyl-1,4-benzoquinol methylase